MSDETPAATADSNCTRHQDQPRSGVCPGCGCGMCFLCTRVVRGTRMCMGCALGPPAHLIPTPPARGKAAILPTGVAVLVLLGIFAALVSRKQHDLSVLQEAAARPTLLGSQGDLPSEPDDSADDDDDDDDGDGDDGDGGDDYPDPAPPDDYPDPAPPDDYPDPAPPDDYPDPAPPGDYPDPAPPDDYPDPAPPGDDPDPRADPRPTPDPDEGGFTFTHQDILGTSMRLVIVTSSRERAAQAERTVLAEIERHRQTFSTYDPQSELSKINALPWQSRRDLRISKYLARVLRWSLEWHEDSRGAFDPYLGDLTTLWRRSTAEGRTPTDRELAAHTGQRPGFKITKRKRGKKSIYFLTCERSGSFDLSGIAKGFIIDRALREIRKRVDGALLEIGGDIAVLGRPRTDSRAGWRIGVADPRRAAENDPPLETVALTHMAIASSGSYARPLKLAGQRRSHILDPRTARPADGVLGATVIAADAATADALATALCILDPQEGIALIERQSVAACVLVDRSGTVHRSRNWRRFRPATPRSLGVAWPAGYAVSITFQQVDSWKTVNRQRGKRRKFKRHGTAVWVEDARGQRVRLVSLWFERGEMTHVRKLKAFWRDGWVLSGSGANYRPLRAVSRATRRPGEYTVVWDGRDDAGLPVPQGRYRVRIDVNRENGPGHERNTAASVEIECGAAPANGKTRDQPELTAVHVEYGPR